VVAQLACTAKRLPGDEALPVIERLLLRGANDAVIPWLVWWAVESKAASDRDHLTEFFADPVNRRGLVPGNLGRLVRRNAAEGTKSGYRAALAASILAAAGRDAVAIDEDFDHAAGAGVELA